MTGMAEITVREVDRIEIGQPGPITMWVQRFIVRVRGQVDWPSPHYDLLGFN